MPPSLRLPLPPLTVRPARRKVPVAEVVMLRRGAPPAKSSTRTVASAPPTTDKSPDPLSVTLGGAVQDTLVVQWQVPAGMRTVSPPAALFTAACTSAAEQLA